MQQYLADPTTDPQREAALLQAAIAELRTQDSVGQLVSYFEGPNSSEGYNQY